MPPISTTQVYVNGDVSIDASAVLAPGAIIQADADSKIIIAAGVCIGMGVIIHAHKGSIEIQSGAILGAGVLVVGKCKIGANACIGAATTIWNSSVEPSQVLAAGSLLGDAGRQVTSAENVLPTESVTQPELNGQPAPTTAKDSNVPTVQTTTVEDTPEQKNHESSPLIIGAPIYGQANLNRLLNTLFPHKQSLNLPPQDNPEKTPDN